MPTMILNENNPITADGDYTLAGIVPGKNYLVTLYGTFGSGTLTLKYICPVTGEERSPLNNSYTQDAEIIAIAPSNQLIFSLAGSTAPSLAVTVTPIQS